MSRLSKGVANGPLSPFVVDDLSSACILVIVVCLVTTQRSRLDIQRRSTAFVIGLALGLMAMVCSQARRWLAVDPAISFTDAAVDLSLFLLVCFCIAMREELTFRYFLDGAFSALAGDG